jgi:hypothetical protein
MEFTINRVRLPLYDFSERTLDCGSSRFLERQLDHRHLQSPAGFKKLLSFWSLRDAHGQIGGLGCRRDRFLEDLKPLSPDLGPGVRGSAGDIAARMREAPRKPGLDRVAPDPNDRCRPGGRADCPRDRVGAGDDHLGVAANDLAGEIGIGLGMPSAGVPIDCEVLSFDVAQSAQLLKKRVKRANFRVVNAVDGTSGNDRYPVLFRLRPHRLRRSREQ